MGIIKRQSITNGIVTYAGIFIGFINLMVIQPKFLTAEELGLTRILYSCSMVIAMFIPMGIGSATTKYFPQFRNPETKNHGYFGFMMLFPVVGFLIASVILYFIKDFIVLQYIKESKLFTEFYNFIFPLSFIIACISCLNIYCYSLLKSTVPVFLNDLVSRLMILILVPVYYIKWITLFQFIVLFTGVYGIQLAMLTFYIFYEEIPGFKIDWDFFRKKNKLINLLKYGWIMWFAVLASIGLKELGTIIIGKFMALQFVAIYAICAFIPTIIEAPLNALERITTSKIAYAWNDQNLTEIKTIYQKSSLYMLLIGGLLFLGININIVDLLSFLPEKYHAGNLVVLIISIGTLFNMATGVNTAILFYSDEYRTGAIFLISLIFISFLFQIFFIPIWGINGAALATAVSGMLFNLANLIFVSIKFHLHPFSTKTAAIVLLVMLCYVLNYFLPQLPNAILNIGYRSVIISLVYFFTVYFLKIVPEFHHHLPFQKNKP